MGYLVVFYKKIDKFYFLFLNVKLIADLYWLFFKNIFLKKSIGQATVFNSFNT
ncbi:MAG: hypothetical protein JWQ34_1534 [Mucilaginibacter sp.]|nr:hypothetical protein [Mucilaginibacter sp.]